MKFSIHWLREWLDTELSSPEIAERLTLAGLEVDAVTPAAPAFSHVVVGRVRSVAPHPDAERLRVCQVELGESEAAQVVCGAPNVRADMYAPMALVGARLPNGTEVGRAELRGVESAGMLCSALELGLSDDGTGLLALAGELAPGQDLRQALGLDDEVIEIDLTPNRGDCLSVLGVARELGVLTGAPLIRDPKPPPIGPACDDRLPVALENPGACPRYTGRVIRGIDVARPSPSWLQERLRRSGVRSLHPVVDITNYVMLELGQPMHAFDLSALEGGIRVRQAQPDERITLLDGQSVALEPEDLVIADETRAIALAGIMGGAASAVGEETRDIFLESAFFAPTAIAGRARRLGLHTDASHRFERGVDPALAAHALERATQLVLAVVGGLPGPVVEALEPACMPERVPIRLREQRIARVLGQALPAGEVTGTLTRLHTAVTPTDDGWLVSPPSFRFDLEREVDLIEELARVHGLDRLPSRHAAVVPRISRATETRVPLAEIRNRLVAQGFREAITYSFVDSQSQRLLNPDQPMVPLANPITSDMDVMRTSLWPGLLNAIRHNLNRQQGTVRLFETGLRFVRRVDPVGELSDYRQEAVLGLAVTGRAAPEQWARPSRPVDFFDLKGDLEALFELTDASHRLAFKAHSHPALHPGQSAQLVDGDRAVGWVGMLSPELESSLDLAQPCFLAEIVLDALAQRRLPEYRALSRFPAIRRDLALVVPSAVASADVIQAVYDVASDTVQRVWLFDVYRGERLGQDRKSLALGLILQDLSRTLTDDEVEGTIARVVAHLGSRFDAALRE